MESVSSRKHKFKTKNKENNVLIKQTHTHLSETRVRTPFSNKNSCFNSENLKNNGLNEWRTQNVVSGGFPAKTVQCLTSEKQITANIPNYNASAKVTKRRKSVWRKIDSEHKPQLIVRVQNISQEDLKCTNYFTSMVDIKRVSGNILKKYMRKSQIIISNTFPRPEDLNKITTASTVDTRQISRNILKKNMPNSQNMLRRTEDSNVSSTAKMEKTKNEVRTLRKRKDINYAVVLRNSSIKEVKDVYEFDSDSEDKKSIQKQIKLDKSIPFESDMKAAMYRIELNDKKKKRKDVSKTNNKAWEFFGATKKKEMSRPKRVGRKIKSPRKNRKINGKVSSLIDNKLVIEKPVTGNDDDDINTALPMNDIEEVPQILTSPKVNILHNVIINAGEKQPDVALSINTSNEEDNIVNITKDFIDLETNSNGLDDISDDDWNYFLTDKLQGPAANSTMMNPKDPSSTPWRLPGVTRNPHFLQYKVSSLPTYNQDMIIDSTATEKLLSGNKTPNYTNQESINKKQTSILSYVSTTSVPGSPDIIESSYCETWDTNESVSKSKRKSNNKENSLFSVHELTPLKSILKSSNKSSNKENKGSPVKRRMEKVKRQILGEETDSSVNIIDVVQENQNKSDKYFGFDTISDEENVTNSPEPKKNGKTGMVWLFGKPLRLDDYINLANTSKNKVVNRNFNAQNVVSDVNDNPDGITNSITITEVTTTVGIFEDLSPVNKTPAPKKYERRNKRRIRRVSTDVEDNEEEEEKPKKRKKDIRTKEEERQAENWAKSFNIMCQEVEEYNLEID